MAGERESLEFCLLGSLEARRDGLPVPLGGAKQKALLARLLIDAPAVVSVDTLIDDLWGEQPPETALHTVQVFVSRLRKALGASALLTQAPGYLVDVASDDIDAGRFRALAAEAESELAGGRAEAAAERFEQAFALWRGQAFAEFAYEAWVRDPAERLEELRLSALEGWTEARLALGRHGELVGELEQLVGEHPLRERFRAQLMLALYRSGRQAEALEVYAHAREALVEQLGIDPSPELQALYRQLLNQDASLAAPAQGPGVTAHNLPAPPNSLVGRERELGELEALLEHSDVRLVTLTGAGGSGKTRLGLELARRLLTRFPDGVVYVELAAITDPDLFAATLAQALAVREQPPQSLEETLAQYLGERRALLVLDNFEQLLAAALPLSGFLAGAPGLKALVTSRTPLHIDGEHEFPLEPLDPAAAEALFVERGCAAGGKVVPGKTVREICRRLDRLPLALELAAARSKVIDPDALLARLDQRLPLLTAGRRDAPERHQTLRATIEWSFDLLGDDTKRLFARLSVFAGGCTLDSAEEVAGANLDAIASLVDKSLLRADRGRVSMLETIREYARERLEQMDEAPALRDRHARHYLEVAREADEQLTGSQQAEWLTRLAQEQDNVRAALASASDSSDHELAVALVAAAGWFWYMRGQFDEGSRWLEAALATEAGSPATRATVLMRAGAIAEGRGDYRSAEAHYREALQLRRSGGDLVGAVSALNNLGALANSQVDYDAANAWYEQALALAREIDDELGIATALGNMGIVATSSGEPARAVSLLEESVTRIERLGHRYALAVTRAALGSALLDLGNSSLAAAHLSEALTLHRELEEPLGVATTLEELAALAAASGQGEHAAAQLGAASAIRTGMGAPLHPVDEVRRGRAVSAARGLIGAERYDEAYREGLATELEVAVESALAACQPREATG